MIMYQLTYSFNADSGLTVIPNYIDETGTVGAGVTVLDHFENSGWYGFTLSVTSNYQGFIGFFDTDENLVAMFAVNPQEGENLDAKVSALRSVGPGGVSYPVNVSDTDDNPIEGAQVWLTTDINGQDTIAGTLISDSSGTVTFEIPVGTYYLWRIASGYRFPNPKTVTVA